jgi:hypothetical protein
MWPSSSFSAEQACARRPIAYQVEAAIGDSAVEVGEVHVLVPARDEIREETVHDIDSVLATAQYAFGLAHERGAKGAIRRLRITGRFHLGCRL